MCLLWKNIYPGFLPNFGFFICCFDSELHELLVYFGYKPQLITSFEIFSPLNRFLFC